VDIRARLPTGERIRDRKILSDSHTKTSAREWGRLRERRLMLEGREGRKEVATFKDFAPRFVDGHARANRQKPGGIAHKETVIRVHLLPMFGNRRLNEISNEDVQRLKHALREKSPKTANNVPTVLSTLLKKAVEWNEMDQVPCIVRLVKTSSNSVKFFDFEDFDRLVQAAKQCSATTHLVLLLGGHAGVRAGEMRALSWDDVNIDKRQLRIERGEWRGHVSGTKGGRTRHIPMTEALAEALRHYRHLRGPLVLYREDGTSFTEAAIRAQVDRATRRAQLPSWGPHALRHTFCSHLAMNGVPARTIQALAGHQSLMTTQRYMHLSPSAIQDGIRALEQRPSFQRGDNGETANANA